MYIFLLSIYFIFYFFFGVAVVHCSYAVPFFLTRYESGFGSFSGLVWSGLVGTREEEGPEMSSDSIRFDSISVGSVCTSV